MKNTPLTVERPDISAVIVSWNAKDFLLDCLRSIKGRGAGKSIEIIVVDNASTDGSPEEVEREFPGVKLIRNETNKGFAAANNIGIEQSTGKYICLINSDVWVLENCLDRLCDYMDSNPSIGMVAPKILNPDMTLQVSCRRFPGLWNNFCPAFGMNRVFGETRFFGGEHMFFFRHDVVRRVNVLVGCFLMVRREALDVVGLLDERFFMYVEDIDWCRRVWAAGWEVVFFPDAQAIHYRGGSSSNAPAKFAMEQERARLQYWKKYHGGLSRSAILLILAMTHALRIGVGVLFLLTKSPKKESVLIGIKRHVTCLGSLFGNGIGLLPSWKIKFNKE